MLSGMARTQGAMPDKGAFGYGFSCDGPGRGGTCDISAWDGFYLAAFWMLNTIGWVTFYWHWKHITLVTNNLSLWTESSTYLMGWECYVGLDVPLRAPDLGNRVHVPNLMARILARADRVYRLGT